MADWPEEDKTQSNSSYWANSVQRFRTTLHFRHDMLNDIHRPIDNQ